MQLDEYAEIVAKMISKLEPNHVLDYGCGANIPLAKALTTKGVTCAFKYQAYAPKVPKLSAMPFPAEMVICLSILGEQKDEIDAEFILDDLRKVTDGAGFFVVAGSKLPMSWWLQRFASKFDLQSLQVTGENEYFVVVYAKPILIEGTDGAKIHA